MLEVLLRDMRALVAGLDVDGLSGSDAREMVAGFAELEKLAASGKLLATGRLVATGVGPGDDSFRDVDAWLASVSGTTVGAARATTRAAGRVLEHAALEDAVRDGALSGAQAEMVATAAAADPHATARLVEVASYSGVKGLRTECDRVIAAASSQEQERATAERVHRDRSLRHPSRPDGSGVITMIGPADRTAAVMAALEPYEAQLFTENRKRQNHEHPDAVAFDAMVACTANAAERAPNATRDGRPMAVLHLFVSHEAFERGHTQPGEICEVQGGGPIPVSTARRLSSDAIVKALVVKGTDVTRVVSLGRTAPAALVTAKRALRRTCAIEGCEVDRHLELDHNEPWAERGATDREDLDFLCGHDHDRKTRHDLRRLGPPGRQGLVTRTEYEAATAAEHEPTRREPKQRTDAA
jgi:hypothetical protein